MLSDDVTAVANLQGADGAAGAESAEAAPMSRFEFCPQMISYSQCFVCLEFCRKLITSFLFSINRRVQQLLLYMRCLHLLSQTLDFSRAELKSKRLKPSTSVKTGEICTLTQRFCLTMTTIKAI